MPTQQCLVLLTLAKTLVWTQKSAKAYDLCKMRLSRTASHRGNQNMNKTWDHSMPIVFGAISSSDLNSTWDSSRSLVFASESPARLVHSTIDKTWNSSRPILFSANVPSICGKCKEAATVLSQNVSVHSIQKRQYSTVKAKKVSRMQQMMLEADTEMITETKAEQARRKEKAKHEAFLEESKTLRTQRRRLLESWRQDFKKCCSLMESIIEKSLHSLEIELRQSGSEIKVLEAELDLRKKQRDLIRKLKKNMLTIESTTKSAKVDFLRIPGIVRHQYALIVMCQVLSQLVSLRIWQGHELIRVVEFNTKPELRNEKFKAIIDTSTELDQMLDEAYQLTMVLRDAYEDYVLENRREKVLKGTKTWKSLKRMVDRPYSRALTSSIIRNITKIIFMYQRSWRRGRRRIYRQHGRYMNTTHMNALLYQWELRLLTVAADANAIEKSWHLLGVFRRQFQDATEYDRYQKILATNLELYSVTDELVFLAKHLRLLPQFPQLCPASRRAAFRQSLFHVIASGEYLSSVTGGLGNTMEEAWRLSTIKRFSMKNYQRMEALRLAQKSLRIPFDLDELDLLSKYKLERSAFKAQPDLNCHILLHDLKQSLRRAQSRTDLPFDRKSIREGLNYVLDKFHKNLDAGKTRLKNFCSKQQIAAPFDLLVMFNKPPKRIPAISTTTSSEYKVPAYQISKKQLEPFGQGGFQIPKLTRPSTLSSDVSIDIDEPTAKYSHTLYRNPNGQMVTVHYCTSQTQCESVARKFLDEKVVGLDLEWKPNVKSSDPFIDNVSLIQIASESRIALFHLAVCSGKNIDEIMAPSLRQLIESPDIVKSGVGIGADATRLAAYLKLQPRRLFELSYLHNVLINRCNQSGAFSKLLYSLDKMVHDYLGFPMDKGKVRTSNWSWKLNHQQCEYAAADAYASLHLYYELNRRCQKLVQRPDTIGFVVDRVGPTNKSLKLDTEEDAVQEEEPMSKTHQVSDFHGFKTLAVNPGNDKLLADRKKARRISIKSNEGIQTSSRPTRHAAGSSDRKVPVSHRAVLMSEWKSEMEKSTNRDKDLSPQDKLLDLFNLSKAEAKMADAASRPKAGDSTSSGISSSSESNLEYHPGSASDSS